MPEISAELLRIWALLRLACTLLAVGGGKWLVL
jgi:hypothetical protein